MKRLLFVRYLHAMRNLTKKLNTSNIITFFTFVFLNIAKKI